MKNMTSNAIIALCVVSASAGLGVVLTLLVDKFWIKRQDK